MSDHPTTGVGAPDHRPRSRRGDHPTTAAAADTSRSPTQSGRRSADPGLRRIPHRARGVPAPTPRAHGAADGARHPPGCRPGTPHRSPASRGSTRRHSAATTAARPTRRVRRTVDAQYRPPEPCRTRRIRSCPPACCCAGQAAAVGGLAPVAVRAVRTADQRRREPPGRPVQRPGGPGQPAAAGLLPDRDAVAEGWRRQNHDHRDAGGHLRRRSAATGWWPSTPTPTAAR